MEEYERFHINYHDDDQIMYCQDWLDDFINAIDKKGGIVIEGQGAINLFKQTRDLIIMVQTFMKLYKNV
jgi:hypothetical protein